MEERKEGRETADGVDVGIEEKDGVEGRTEWRECGKGGKVGGGKWREVKRRQGTESRRGREEKKV